MRAHKLIGFFAFLCVLCASVVNLRAQETQPAPGAPKSVSVPAVQEKKLPNGLTVATVERKGSPLVTIQLLIKSGSSAEDASVAGLADMTATMLTKGTTTKTASQVAESIEFLGATINSGAFWGGSFVSVTATADKIDQALAILADVVLRPKFAKSELDLLKTQSLDGLTYNLKQPSFLANYVASNYAFGEHPVGGTPASITALDEKSVKNFYRSVFRPDNAVLIFAGDISAVSANTLARKHFSGWKRAANNSGGDAISVAGRRLSEADSRSKKILVIDLPNSGQASVIYAKKLDKGRLNGGGNHFYPAQTYNSVLGGGYSSRLNYEIRIKRGLSYGAGSSIQWRNFNANFATRVQTKNESAPEVVELILAEIRKIGTSKVDTDELTPRKAVLTGSFGRNLETTSGLAVAISDLYAFGTPTSELNRYMPNISAVTAEQVQNFATDNTQNGDIIIVGDYSIFKDDLAKRFPGMKIEVIKADELDLSKENLRK